MSLPIVLKTPTVAARFARRIGVYLQFLREFIDHPTTVGAIAPSSAALAFAMLKPIDFTRVRTIAAGHGQLHRTHLEPKAAPQQVHCS
jgi:phospholipid N-methyltransferase